MKTPEQIQAAIDTANKEVDYKTVTKRELTAIKNKVAMLTLCKVYLQTNPSSEFVTKERDRLNNRLELIDKQFDDYLKFNIGDKKKLREKYNAEYNVDKLYKQLRVLDFILS